MIEIECFGCGHRRMFKEPKLNVPDTTLEKAVMELQLTEYVPCSVCGKRSWRIVDAEGK